MAGFTHMTTYIVSCFSLLCHGNICAEREGNTPKMFVKQWLFVKPSDSRCRQSNKVKANAEDEGENTERTTSLIQTTSWRAPQRRLVEVDRCAFWFVCRDACFRVFFLITSNLVNIEDETVFHREASILLYAANKLSTDTKRIVDRRDSPPVHPDANVLSMAPRPFPRWGETYTSEESHGLDFAPILDFIVNSSAAAYAPKQTQYRNRAYISTKDHMGDVGSWYAEVLYVIDGRGLWTSRRHRTIAGLERGVVVEKLVPTENMAIAAWKFLKADETDSCRKWPRLCDVLLRSKHDDAVSGFPYLSWYGDYTGCNYKNWKETYSIPLFTTAAAVDCNYTFPFPTFNTDKTAKDSVADWDAIFAQNHNTYPWKDKLPQVVWRGSLTGKIVNETHKSPRWNMVQMVTDLKRKHMKTKDDLEERLFLFDVAAVRLPPRHRKWKSSLHEVGGLGTGIQPMEDFQKFRAILDMDGNSWSSRFSNLLCYNSVVLKVDPTWVDYFQYKKGNDDLPQLEPWKHYIPVKADLSDLVEKATFVVDPANDKFLTDVVLRANAWCRQNMVRRAVINDVLNIWERYVELLDVSNSDWRDKQWIFGKQTIFEQNSPLDMILLPGNEAYVTE